jgi:hypothetical protein
MANNITVWEDSYNVVVPGAYKAFTGPQLALNVANPTAAAITWTSPAPSFVLQQTDKLGDPTHPWTNSPFLPVINGASNTVTIPVGANAGYYRAVPR